MNCMNGGLTMINEKNKDVICAAPWSHLYMDPAGLVRPCCTSDIIYGDSNISSVTDIWHSPTAIKFRTDLLEGKKQSGCEFCYKQEKYSGYSLRTMLNQLYGETISDDITPDMVIKYLDIRSSNLCNMACIMCGSEYSSLWYDDAVALHGSKNHTWPKFINITKETEKDIIENILSNNIDLVYFAGGEPLITPYHYELLEKLISMGISNDINLRYNTNLSTLKYKSVDLVERWSHFKSVEIAASIDMIGEQAELHRYGTDWKSLSKNLHTVRFDIPNVSLRPQITVTALSIGYLPELLTYFIDELGFTNEDIIHSNLVFGLIRLSPQVLPKSIKELYTNKLERFLENSSMHTLLKDVITMSTNQMNEKDESSSFHEMTEYMDSLDKLRGTDWRLLWPEIANTETIDE